MRSFIIQFGSFQAVRRSALLSLVGAALAVAALPTEGTTADADTPASDTAAAEKSALEKDPVTDLPANRPFPEAAAAKKPADTSASKAAAADNLLRGTPLKTPAKTPAKPLNQPVPEVEKLLARTLQPRSDRPSDWYGGIEPLHYACEPRWLNPCIPPPPCPPSEPPHPYDLIGVRGEPTCGPIYSGPCAPRTGTHDDCRWATLHRWHDRFFDCFYRPK